MYLIRINIDIFKNAHNLCLFLNIKLLAQINVEWADLIICLAHYRPLLV
jgi:hypothetical protein